MPIIRCTQKLLVEVGTSNQTEAIANLGQSSPLDEWALHNEDMI
jgi:hypothetical protein